MERSAMHDQPARLAFVIVALPAVIDLASQDLAYERLCAAVAESASVVIADLTATVLCDCSSLRRLIAIQHQAVRGGQLRLAITPGSPVHLMAQRMDLDHLLPIYSSTSQATAAGSLPHLNTPGARLLAQGPEAGGRRGEPGVRSVRTRRVKAGAVHWPRLRRLSAL